MIISVHAKPGSKKPGIDLKADGSVAIRVAARPIDGKANEAVIESLAAALDVAPSRIRLVAGEKSKIKRFEIPDGISLAERIK